MEIPDGRESDGELYSLAVSGSKEAIAMLVDRHDATLTMYIRAKTNVSDVADDAVADAWLKFFDHLKKARNNPDETLRKPESVRFWLYRTALNSLRGMFRQAGRQRSLTDRVTTEAVTSGALSYTGDEFERLEISERHEALRKAFGQLSDKCRELLAMLSTDPPMSLRRCFRGDRSTYRVDRPYPAALS